MDPIHLPEALGLAKGRDLPWNSRGRTWLLLIAIHLEALSLVHVLAPGHLKLKKEGKAEQFLKKL